MEVAWLRRLAGRHTLHSEGALQTLRDYMHSYHMLTIDCNELIILCTRYEENRRNRTKILMTNSIDDIDIMINESNGTTYTSHDCI